MDDGAGSVTTIISFLVSRKILTARMERGRALRCLEFPFRNWPWSKLAQERQTQPNRHFSHQRGKRRHVCPILIHV
jgi:hypothetical protein